MGARPTNLICDLAFKSNFKSWKKEKRRKEVINLHILSILF